MKKLILLMMILFSLLVSVSLVSASFPCYTSTAKLGVISSIDSYRDENLRAVHIEKPYNFWEKVQVDGAYSIDVYSEMVQELVDGKKANIQDAEIKNQFSKNVYILRNTQKYYALGDIVVEGPPSHSCGPSFNAVYSKEGDLKYAHMRNYEVFNKGDTIIRASPGQEIDCFTGKCNVHVNFNIDGEQFNVKPGQAYILEESDVVKAVYLFEAKAPGETAPDYDTMDWGSVRYADYIVEFFPEEDEEASVVEEDLDEEIEGEAVEENMAETQESTAGETNRTVSVEIPTYVWWIAILVVIILIALIAMRPRKKKAQEHKTE